MEKEKFKEIVLYLIFGVLTTLVNLGVFWLFDLMLGKNLYLVSNIIAWIVAVVFAFVTNKPIVFKSYDWSIKTIAKEGSEFLGARIFSFGVEELGLWILVDLLKMKNIVWNIFSFSISGTFIAKVVLAVIVVILNYFFSKFIIFAKKKTNKTENEEQTFDTETKTAE